VSIVLKYTHRQYDLLSAYFAPSILLLRASAVLEGAQFAKGRRRFMIGDVLALNKNLLDTFIQNIIICQPKYIICKVLSFSK